MLSSLLFGIVVEDVANVRTIYKRYNYWEEGTKIIIILRQCNCLTKNTKESTKKLLDLTGQFGKEAGHKINI